MCSCLLSALQTLTNTAENMAPEVTHFNDLHFVAESFDPATRAFLDTTFALIEKEDEVYFGQLAIRKLRISLEEYSAALVRVPDDEIYPKVPESDEQDDSDEQPLASNLYLKRPRLVEYEEYKDQDCVEIIPGLLLDEARNLEAISRLPPHPGIIGYHGCRVRRGFITGLVLDRHPADLKHHVKDEGGPPLDKAAFLGALESALAHLHTLGLAHNDVNPANILVSETGMPVLVDFDSCRPIGQRLLHSRGTPGWTDESDSWDTHDTFGIGKIRAWLDEQLEVVSPTL
ncbi:hypothetical protein CTA2_8237 [Colletotrichum tanaceti]|uniref:Protein kinase domain-containing protein n=1 Tax=Colletotrichum tanaceti TaxID=1306861 RepID=A0A4U6X3W7_9PEZI|nr:hypothetical protein CTA2_8237 [Colletotrichum tanaceti]TKW50062.1 hypothetical protein CTA1_4655 [Colletotrichum tanaceti]